MCAVLLADDKTCRVADFGISCTLQATATQLGRVLHRVDEAGGEFESEHKNADKVSTIQGTPFYMAPEVRAP